MQGGRVHRDLTIHDALFMIYVIVISLLLLHYLFVLWIDRYPSTLKGHTPRRSYLQLASAIDLESVQLKQSMGALLHYLQSNVFNMDDGTQFITVALKYIVLP